MVLWFEQHRPGDHKVQWPGDHKVQWPGDHKVQWPVVLVTVLEQGTSLSLLQSTQLYKWVNLSHHYCNDFS